MELLGKRCHKLALPSPGASQAHPAAPVLLYSSPCPPCHSAILAVRVSATGVPAVPRPWPAVTVPADGCFQKEGDANQALDVSHITLAREGSTCAVSAAAGEGGRRERAWVQLGNTGRKIAIF